MSTEPTPKSESGPIRHKADTPALLESPSPATTKAAIKADKPDALTTITERDIKLLWGRAASRCAFPECPHELTMDSTAGDASAIGEMAHIVGEKKAAARGTSVLPLAQRNTYSNLILLCPTHHTMIDKKENWGDYAVEVLHEMKDQHEARVRELFAAKTAAEPVDPSDVLYADLVDRCTKHLMLEHWEWFADGAVRQILPEEIDEAQPAMAKLILGTVWPGKHEALEKAIVATATAFVDFVDHFRSKAMLSGHHYKPDHAYKQWPTDRRLAEQVVMDDWHRVSFWLLHRYVGCLNVFAAEVRKALNPMYFLLQGSFLLRDAMGVWHELEDVIWKPELEAAESMLAKLGYKPR